MSNDLVSSDNWQTIIEESEPLLDKVFSDGKGNTYQFIGVIHASDDYYYCMTNTLGKLKMLSCVVDLKGHGYKLITDSDNITTKTIRFDDKYLHVELEDGRVISTPMNWYKELQNASFKQLKNYQFICRGTGIEWTDLDYQLSIESMLQSAPTTKSGLNKEK